jgi:paraquat-inducible protein A
MAVLVLLTTIGLPAAEHIALIGLLLPLRMGTVPAWTRYAYRLALFLRPWVLVDVFLLAALISWSRLSQIAEAYTSAGLFAVGGYVILRALAWQAFEPQEVWRRVEEIEGVPATCDAGARA